MKTAQTAEQAVAIISEMRAKTSRKAAARLCHVGLYHAPLSNWSECARKEWIKFYTELTQ